MDILADTGILLRFMEPNDPSCLLVQDAVKALRRRGDRIVFALQNAAEFWNVSTRPASARSGMGLSIAETDRRLTVIETTFPTLHDSKPTFGIWRKLVVAHSVKGKQVHDARLVALMKANGIAYILTLNASDSTRYPGIVAIDPTNP